MTDPIQAAEDLRAGALHRAGRASSELSMTDEIFTQLRAGAIEKWAATGIDHIATREKLFLTVQTIDAVRKALFEAVENGKVEAFARHQAEMLSPAYADRTR